MTLRPLVILSALLCVAVPLTHSQIFPANAVENSALDINAGEVNRDPLNAAATSLAVDKVLIGNADEDGSHEVIKGDTLTYTITATNSGGTTLTGVVVSDNLTDDSEVTVEKRRPSTTLGHLT